MTIENQKIDPEMIKRLPAVAPTFEVKKDGSVAWEKLPTRWFWLAMSGLLLMGGGIFLWVFSGHEPSIFYDGIAINTSANLCAPYHRTQVWRKFGDQFPAPAGWTVFASGKPSGEAESPIYFFNTPLGTCSADTLPDCCRQLPLTLTTLPKN